MTTSTSEGPKAGAGSPRRRIRRKASTLTLALLALAAISAVGVLISGCGSGTKLTVPVLWAADQSDGSVAGGIEPATVEVRSTGEPGFSLDLEDIKAEGAGEQWQAASSSAAAVGTLMSGSDPNEVDVHFDVTGPIDGPSGGGALTVGVLAAIRDQKLRPGVTMTGTVNPNGSLGPVTNVTTKVRAAAREGFDTVLIPPGTEVEYDPKTGREVEMVELGRSLDVNVRVAPDIGTAYRAFTGRNLAPGAGEPARMARKTRKITRSSTANLDRRIAAVLADAPPGSLSPQATTLAEEALAASDTADNALPYALGVGALKALERDRLSARVDSVFEESGPAAARKFLATKVREIDRRAESTSATAARQARDSYEQQILVPVALGWITYSTALLEVVSDRLDDEPDRRTLEELARVTADAEASIDVFGPDALKTALASRPEAAPPNSQEEVSSFLSGYTNFLIEGGKANERYFDEVVSQSGLGGVPDYISAAFQTLGRSAEEIPEDTNPIDQEVVQASKAISYFVVGAILVSGDSILGLKSFGLGRDISPEADSQVLRDSTEGALAIVDFWSSALQKRGLDMSYPVWSNRWGRAGFEALRGTNREATGSVLALEEAWYSAIGCFMLSGISS